MIGRMFVGLGFLLILVGSAFIDGELYNVAVTMCVVGVVLVSIPVFVTYYLPSLSRRVRKVIAGVRRDRGLRVIDGGKQ